MKNANKIRQLLSKTRKWIEEEGGVVCPHKYGMCKHDNENCPVFCIDQALALLPCETCNGTKIRPEAKRYPDGLTIGRVGDSCPDCQKERANESV